MQRNDHLPDPNGPAVPETPVNEEMLSMAELADYLGKSRQSIYQMRARGNFPFKTYGSGRKLRVARSEVDTFLESKGSHVPRMIRQVFAPAAQSRRVEQDLEVRLDPNVTLVEADRLLRAIHEGRSVSITLDESGCTIRVN